MDFPPQKMKLLLMYFVVFRQPNNCVPFPRELALLELVGEL
jgi:hypothetical protein